MIRLPHTRLDRLPAIEHGRRPIRGVVIHDTEALSLDGVRGYFASGAGGNRTGAHVLIDNARAVQLADLDALVWHARGANAISVGFELLGFASWPRRKWLARRRQLKMAANRVAWVCWSQRLGLPRRRVNVWGHVDFPAGGHHDPGPGFPWSRGFMALCRRAYRKLEATKGKHWL